MQFRSIVSLACAVSLFTGSALASAVYARRVDELTMERDIYASREENWMNKAVERKETIEQLQTEVEQLTDTIAADQSIALTYAGEFHCTAYCSEEYPQQVTDVTGQLAVGRKVAPADRQAELPERHRGGRDGGRRHQHLSLWHSHSD